MNHRILFLNREYCETRSPNKRLKHSLYGDMAKVIAIPHDGVSISSQTASARWNVALAAGMPQ